MSDGTLPRTELRKLVGFVAKVSFSFGILAWLVSQTDVARMISMLRSVSATAVVVALLLLLLQTLVTAYRWVVVSNAIGVGITKADGLNVVLVSLLLNQCFPSYVGGDAYRIYWLKRQGTRLSPSFRSVMIDRMSAFIALFVMLAVALPWTVARFDEPSLDAALWILAAVGLGGTVAFLLADRLLERWRANAFISQIATLSSDARRLLLRDRAAMIVGPLAIVVHVLTAGTTFALVRGLNLPLTLVDCVLITPPVMLLTAIPVSIAGWGMREGAVVGMLSIVGVDSTSALSLSLLLGVAVLVNALLGFLPLLRRWERYSPF
jgi:uncharacterized protein (TIRG00374 family)